MIPLIVFSSYRAGAFWMPQHATHLDFSRSLGLDSIRFNLQQYIYGSISLAILAGIAFGLSTYGMLKLFKTKTTPAA